MADKDYKVQVGVQATADTRGLEQINKGLDKVRDTARDINSELSEGTGQEALDDIGQSAEEAATNLDAAATAGEELTGKIDEVAQAGVKAGEAINQAGDKGEQAMRRISKSATATGSRLVSLKGKMMATLNAPNELASYYERGKQWGQMILDTWDSQIEGIDKAAIKRNRELNDRLGREAQERDQAYTSALTNSARDRVYDAELRKVTDINDLYTKRIGIIGLLADNRTAEVDHVEALRKKEVELQRTIIATQEIRGQISPATAKAMMADVDAREDKASAKSQMDRQQIALDASVQARDELVSRIDKIKAAQDAPQAGMTPDEYIKAKRELEGFEARGGAKKMAEDIKKQPEALRQAEEVLAGMKEGSDPLMKEWAKKNLEYLKSLPPPPKQEELDRMLAMEDKVAAVEQGYRDKGMLGRYDANNAGEIKMTEDVKTLLSKEKGLKKQREAELKTLQEQLELADANVQTQRQTLHHQQELNKAESRMALAKADQASATAAAERRQTQMTELASRAKKVQDQWSTHRDQLTADPTYKDRETPALKKLLAQGTQMAAAGYMSEQDAINLGKIKEEAVKGLPKTIKAKVDWMVTQLVKGYAQVAVGEQEVLTPLERKDREAGRYKSKLDGLADVLPSLPKDGAAAKMVDVLKDVARYGTLNEATVAKLRGLTMRIDAGDEAGMRVVTLVKDLINGELGRILLTMSRATKAPAAKPPATRQARLGPDGRDLEGEARERERIRNGQPPMRPRPAQPVQEPSSIVSELANRMFNQPDHSGRMLDIMQQLMTLATQAGDKSKQTDARLSSLERELARVISRAQYRGK